jgi:diadenosine tetraphosphate (Ap4A) HIT family hydrolase
VIGRHRGDPAWPGPVWGHSPPVPWPDPATAPLARLVSKAW